MKISNKFPQFEQYPTLFVVSGEFEVHFLVASNGEIITLNSILLNPRDEAREKQGFIHASRGAELGAVSHRERYHEELKNKFYRQVNSKISDILKDQTIKSICLLTPNYDSKRIMQALSKPLKSKIHMVIYGEFTKRSLADIIKLYTQELKRAKQFMRETQIDSYTLT